MTTTETVVHIVASGLTPAQAKDLCEAYAREHTAIQRWAEFTDQHPAEAETIERFRHVDDTLTTAYSIVRYGRYRRGAVNEALFVAHNYQRRWPGR